MKNIGYLVEGNNERRMFERFGFTGIEYDNQNKKYFFELAFVATASISLDELVSGDITAQIEIIRRETIHEIATALFAELSRDVDTKTLKKFLINAPGALSA